MYGGPVNRAITNRLATDVEATAAFCETLLGTTRRGDLGWSILPGHDGTVLDVSSLNPPRNDRRPEG